MSDFDQFLQAVRWTAKPGVEAGDPRPWEGTPIDGLPELSALLASATATPVVMGDQTCQLLAFGPQDARRGWFTPQAMSEDSLADADVLPLHRDLLTQFGGIGDTFGMADGWWSGNHRDILTTSSVAVDFKEMLDHYAWIWEDDGLEVPITAEDYYVVAQEANGNLTLVHRKTGDLILFAPDHAYDGLSVLEGCPPYSLYTIDGMPDLVTWIEGNARTWLAL